MSKLGELTQVYIYPVKSLPGIPLQSAIMTKFGIAHPENIKVVDRLFIFL
jgi:uncharacterized protein YcbX